MTSFILNTQGTYGDVVPFLALGALLRGRGHQVVLVTNSRYREDAKRVGIHFDTWDNEASFSAYLSDGPLLDTPLGIATFAERHIIPAVSREYAVLARYAGKRDVVVLSKHLGNFAALLLSERLDLTHFPVILSPAQATTFLFYVQLSERFLAPHLNQFRAHCGLQPVKDWESWCRSNGEFLGCWPSWFYDPQTEWPVRVRNLGLLLDDRAEGGDLPQSVCRLLKKSGHEIVLISGGSALWSLASEFYRTATQAVALSGRPGLLVSPHRSLVPEKLPENIMWVPKLPFATLLPQVGIVVHHGGAGIFARALCSGVPQIVMPFGADRPEIARIAKRVGVGLHIPPTAWEPEILLDGLVAVAANSTIYNRCKEVKAEMEARRHEDFLKACKALNWT